ncbi:MBL fold metallo-hydrolase [uncultured Serinicoccus sp.]|uniref:MBL fold metallo-hydrolase n=1 Tax=uncultured Serinicoccus sp. TaxID=735514 RepID=UPI0026155A1C|nr:MBL fold metallo-hydrolase [uncultured Serinicoccus sp.]
MQITHLGHACLLVEVADQRILLDPGVFSSVEDVTGLTAVVVTHQHPDHLDPERTAPLLAANPQARVLMEAQTAQSVAESAYADRVGTLSAGESVELGPADSPGRVTLTGVGDRHAVIHPYVPRIGNTGVVVRAEGEPVLYHPGDALDGDPGPVDLLGVPVSAPWGKVAEAIAFVRRIAPAQGVVPIHDGLLNDRGRGMYLQHIGDFGADGGVAVHDLRGAGATTFPR